MIVIEYKHFDSLLVSMV